MTTSPHNRASTRYSNDLRYREPDHPNQTALTPPDVLEPVRCILDGIELDPCTTIIWAKPNPMPESVTDRPTKAHEYLFLLAKQPRYFMDMEAIREPISPHNNGTVAVKEMDGYCSIRDGLDNSRTQMKRTCDEIKGANRRSVWTIPTEPFPEAHFATYPQALVRPCVLAGSSERGECVECGAPWVREVERTPMVIARSERTHSKGHTRSSGTVLEPNRSETTGWRASCQCANEAADDGRKVPETRPQTILDPFIGSGTTALVARNHGRRCIGIDLSREYLEIAARRLQQLSLFATPTTRGADS